MVKGGDAEESLHSIERTSGPGCDVLGVGNFLHDEVVIGSCGVAMVASHVQGLGHICH